MIKKIVKALKKNELVSDYKIIDNTTSSHQGFFVLGKLETTRLVVTHEYNVTVYHRFTEDDVTYIGESSFEISHLISTKELNQLINDALYSAKFVKNKDYQLVLGDKKKTFKGKKYDEEPMTIINNIAKIFNDQATDSVRFNALEVFVDENKISVINSQNVYLTKEISKIFVEAIPSYYGKENVELYTPLHYSVVDYKKIESDAKQAILDVISRGNAIKLADLSKVDIILRENECQAFFNEVISFYSFGSVYAHMNDKNVGDMLQENPVADLITINKIPESKANCFDADGVIQTELKVVENGKLVSYYGDNKHASYLDLKPNGNTRMIKVLKGTTSFKQMTKKPHIEIIALSGIQIEAMSNYIGGEVRLALYFDGKNYTPVSGFSFSGSFKDCLNDITLSKEEVKTSKYQGPKYIKFNNLNVM